MDLEFLQLVFPLFVALVGFPALTASVMNALKAFKVLKDGDAPDVSMFFNLLGFAGVFYLVLTGKIELLKVIDLQLGILASFVVSFTTFAIEIGLTKVFHNALRGVPLIGYSHSLKKK